MARAVARSVKAVGPRAPRDLLTMQDVLSTTDELLARTAAVTDQAELAGLYRAQLLHATDQVHSYYSTPTNYSYSYYSYHHHYSDYLNYS